MSAVQPATWGCAEVLWEDREGGRPRRVREGFLGKVLIELDLSHQKRRGCHRLECSGMETR